MLNNLSFIKQTLYSLKRDYGVPLNIVWRTSSTPNLEKGTKAVAKESLMVSRAIVLPSNLERSFTYDLTFIASNKNFTYGGLYDKRHRRVLIDASDLPTGFKLEIGFFFIYNQKRYEIKVADEFELNAGWFILGEQIDNIELGNVIQKNYYTFLDLQQSVEVTIL